MMAESDVLKQTDSRITTYVDKNDPSGEIEDVIPEINNANTYAQNINKEKDDILSKVENISSIS